MSTWFEERDYFLIARCDTPALESSNARVFKEELAAAVGEYRRSLIVDLSSVHEIDSSGLGALVAVLKWVRRFGGSMRVCGLRPAVREVVELTMLHRILPLHLTVEDAIDEETAHLV